MKTLLIVSMLILGACGRSASNGSVQPAPSIQTNLPKGGWGYSNPGGYSPILTDYENGTAIFTTAGVTTMGVPSQSAVNGMVFSSMGICAGQPGATRAPNFSELYFVFGSSSVTWVTTLINGVEGLVFVSDGQIYTINNPGYACNVSFVSGVPTYH